MGDTKQPIAFLQAYSSWRANDKWEGPRASLPDRESSGVGIKQSADNCCSAEPQTKLVLYLCGAALIGRLPNVHEKSSWSLGYKLTAHRTLGG